MKQLLRWQLATLLMLCASTASADNVGLDFNVHVGNAPRQQVIVREPVYHRSPPGFQINEDINFLRPSSLGFYVAVGLPYDLFYVDNDYYLYRDGNWHRARYSRGPWVTVSHRDLPRSLRRHNIEQLRHYRDQEYRAYRQNERNYRGRHFRSHKEQWQADRRQEKRDDRREKREERREKGRHQDNNERRNH